jgi:hypothetical protein
VVAAPQRFLRPHDAFVHRRGVVGANARWLACLILSVYRIWSGKRATRTSQLRPCEISLRPFSESGFEPRLRLAPLCLRMERTRPGSLLKPPSPQLNPRLERPTSTCSDGLSFDSQILTLRISGSYDLGHSWDIVFLENAMKRSRITALQRTLLFGCLTMEELVTFGRRRISDQCKLAVMP